VSNQPYKPQPIEMAHFDQAHAAASQTLDDLIAIHRDELAAPGETREVSIVGLSVFLLGGSDAESLATLLAIAVDRLADQEAEK